MKKSLRANFEEKAEKYKCRAERTEDVMKKEEINIRDPFVMLANGVYYMYGTRGAHCWGEDDGLDCYYSEDLENWTGPVEVFHKPEGFWADRNYWAPECHQYQGAYYIFASFKNNEKRRGTQILKSDSPLGPFHVHSQEPVTPADWECLDGTFYVSPDGTPYVVFCHEWVQIGTGTVCARQLSADLTHPVTEPKVLFEASEAPWIRSVSPSEKNRIEGVENYYVTDGPFMHRCKDGTLLLLWSSFGSEGYTEAIARSENGDITGPWKQEEKLLFEKDGGHGMLFWSKEGKLYLVLHTPNKHLEEHPVFYEIKEENGTLVKL